MSLLALQSQASETEATVQRVANLDARISRVEVRADLAGLDALLRAEPAELALVDLGAEPIEALRRLAPLVRRHRDTRFVAVCDRLDSPVVLEAMQIGARSCIERGRLADELTATFDRLLEDLSPAVAGGRLVTVLGSKGGVGATSLAVQLAEELRGEGEALLVDLDESTGGLSQSLGLRGSFGVADVLERGAAVDPELVRSTAQDAGKGLSALMSPAVTGSGEASPLVFDALHPFLAACRGAYAVTVIDAGRVPRRAALALARESDAVLVLFQLSVVDLKSARRLLALLAEGQVAADRVHAVANRVRKRGGLLTLGDARETLGSQEILTIANDYEAVAKSLDLGRPLAACSPRSHTRRDVQRLADRLGLAAAPTGDAR